jgi:hypothetical protein
MRRRSAPGPSLTGRDVRQVSSPRCDGGAACHRWEIMPLSVPGGCLLGSALKAITLAAISLMGLLAPVAHAAPVIPVTPTADSDGYVAQQLPIASPITDHFALRADFSWGRVSSRAQFNTPAVTGTPFSAEQDLGLSPLSYQWRMELIFRMRTRNRLRVNFLDLPRQALRQVSTPLTIAGLRYGGPSPLDNPVQSSFDWRQMDITYTYSFLQGERYELGAGLGVHFVEAMAMVQIPNTAQQSQFSGSGPFATIALDGTFRIARQWSLNARGQYLHLGLSSASGSLGIYHADLQYRPLRNLAVGLGYEYQDAQLHQTDGNPSGTMQFDIKGPEAFVRLSF